MTSADTARSLLVASNAARARMMVEDSANILKRFYFLQRSLVLMQAGWLPGTEHWGSKLLLPEFLWQDSLIARDLRQRVLELRYPERRIAPDQDEALLALWSAMADAPDGIAFVEGLRGIIKPLLAATYRDYLAHADHLDDGPTVRILRQAIQDHDEQVASWEQAAEDARRVYPERFPDAERWVAALRPLAAALAGLLMSWPLPADLPAFDPQQHGGRPFAISRQGQRDKRFTQLAFAWPDRLDPGRGPGEGLELQVRQAVHHINEVWAAEMAGACLFDLAGSAPPDFLFDAARWCYDEIRHCRMGYTRLLNWGFAMAEMPLDSYSYDAGATGDALVRLGIIFYFESTYIHTKWQRFRIFGAAGDRVSSHDMDFDWADEQIHTHYGTRWLEHFLKEGGDPRKPVDFRTEAEAAVRHIRQGAGPAAAQATEDVYCHTLDRARVDLICFRH